MRAAVVIGLIAGVPWGSGIVFAVVLMKANAGPTPRPPLELDDDKALAA